MELQDTLCMNKWLSVESDCKEPTNYTGWMEHCEIMFLKRLSLSRLLVWRNVSKWLILRQKPQLHRYWMRCDDIWTAHSSTVRSPVKVVAVAAVIGVVFSGGWERRWYVLISGRFLTANKLHKGTLSTPRATILDSLIWWVWWTFMHLICCNKTWLNMWEHTPIS